MNTATMRFTLPTNVTMTSASGKFLSAVSNSAVPEPGTWLTMILGFGVIGVFQRRRTVLRFV
ncbi:PEPxxWA-CTERM sorting domain-containing protein [uncultured Sphingomonas sp.]|uniref:PEPxxWA-CTERM sorting domain-containing protein n=1 Tax=uncultured Sphingomonas sp. TaxID=158754 RepID=UPI0030FC3230